MWNCAFATKTNRKLMNAFNDVCKIAMFTKIEQLHGSAVSALIQLIYVNFSIIKFQDKPCFTLHSFT